VKNGVTQIARALEPALNIGAGWQIVGGEEAAAAGRKGKRQERENSDVV
jgi:hypothetical protein